MYVVDPMGDETRWTVYERLEGEAKFNPNFVRAIRWRCMQGWPNRRPRYDSGEIRVETETDGRIEVYPAHLTVLPKLDYEAVEEAVDLATTPGGLIVMTHTGLRFATMADQNLLIERINKAIDDAKASAA